MPELVFEDKESFFITLMQASVYLSSDPLLFSRCCELVNSQSDKPMIIQNSFENYKEELKRFIESFTCLSPQVSDNCDRIYIDGCWDIMHSGHFNAIRQAKMLGKTLVVGIHNDEEIMRNKGMPVMNNEERVAMIKACKWVDEVVENAPYSATMDWLDSVNCKYIAHGDDIAINCDGQDAYGQLKSAGRFKVIKRTEGISTTSIVGKLLLETKESKQSVSEHFVTNDITLQPTFLATTRRIFEFSNKGVKPKGRVVYIDGSFDLFHVGHVETLKKAKALGDFLIVGVHDDQTVNFHKGSNYPIMNLYERVLNVLAVKYVDEVVIASPWVVTEDLLKSLNISLVVQGTINKLDLEVVKTRKQSLDYNDNQDPYELPKRLSIYQEVPSERNIETQHIIQRIIDNRLRHLNKFKRSSKKEENYYANTKTYIEEI
jgi:ethanolamine-phosphate cytidylyltransferase